MTQISDVIYTDPATLKTCSCGCNRLADTFKFIDGLSTYCRHLVTHKSQRAVTIPR